MIIEKYIKSNHTPYFTADSDQWARFILRTTSNMVTLAKQRQHDLKQNNLTKINLICTFCEKFEMTRNMVYFCKKKISIKNQKDCLRIIISQDKKNVNKCRKKICT